MKKITTKIFIEDKDGMVLFLIKPNDSLWTLPGGKPHKNELPSITIRREVMEETGINLQYDMLIDCGISNINGKSTHIYYTNLHDRGFSKIKLSKEHEDYILIDRDMVHLLNDKMKSGIPNIIQQIQATLDKLSTSIF